MKTLKPLLIFTTFLLLFGSQHQTVFAEMLYSVERGNDNLVLIDSDTGNVTQVGALSFDALDIDLTMMGSRLFALNANSGTDVVLYELNTTNGSVLSSATVFEGATQITFAESLANINGQLKIGYNRVGIFASNSLGTLGINGQVTHVGTNAVLDFDAMGINRQTNTLHGSDVVTLAPLTNFFTINETPVITISNYLTGVPHFSNDIAINSGRLFSVDHSDAQLQIINLGTNQVSTVNINTPGTYLGLAIASVPEPSSFILLGCMFGFLGLRRLRKHAFVATP